MGKTDAKLIGVRVSPIVRAKRMEKGFLTQGAYGTSPGISFITEIFIVFVIYKSLFLR